MVGGWFPAVVIVRLSQPGLAGIGVGAEFVNLEAVMQIETLGKLKPFE